MKKLILMVLCACVLIAGAVAVAEPVPEPVYNEISIGGYQYSDYLEEELVFDLGEAYEYATALGSKGVCAGACHYNWVAGVAVEIQCDVPDKSGTNTIVGRNRYSLHDKIIMCNYQPVGGIWQWVRVGSCDRDSIVKLLVNGHDAIHDAIGIVNPPFNPPGNQCDFKPFTNVFEAGWLKIYGKDKCDSIYGSRFDDYKLEGEYVEGKAGDDNIYLTTNDLGVCVAGIPTAIGQRGGDYIYGTDVPSIYDYVWADVPNDPTGAGDDRVWGFSGDDWMAGGYGDDRIWGGRGDDHMWGGADNDRLFGEQEDDYLYGGNGAGGPDGLNDYCNGGAGTNVCDDDCETTVNCI